MEWEGHGRRTAGGPALQDDEGSSAGVSELGGRDSGISYCVEPFNAA